MTTQSDNLGCTGLRPGNIEGTHTGRKTFDEVFEETFLQSVADKIGNKWKELAKGLNFTEERIKKFLSDSKNNAENAAYDMLTAYKKREDNYGREKAIDRLIKSLEKVELHSIAAKITRSQETHIQPSSTAQENAARTAGSTPQQNAAKTTGRRSQQNASEATGSRTQQNAVKETSSKSQKESLKMKYSTPEFYQTKSQKDDIYEVFLQGSKRHGFAVVVNFTKDRDGAVHDEEKMVDLFQQLGYSCKTFRDKTKEEILKKLKDTSKLLELKQHDSIILFFMANGKPDQISDVKGEPILYTDLFEIFSNKNCPNLNGKPKFFFFQSCRGDKKGKATEGKLEQDSASVPSQSSDILKCFATVNGEVALRHTVQGSPFVNAMREVFMTQSKDKHVVVLMTEVNDVMHGKHYNETNAETGKTEVMVQCTEIISTLRKQFYFFPGMPKKK